MKTLADRDLGIDCDFVAKADSDNEVIRMSTDHIKEAHPDQLEEVREAMRANVKTE